MNELLLSFVDWDRLCLYKYLPEDILRQYEDKLRWDVLSTTQYNMPEDLIEKHMFDVHMENIFRQNKLSEDFIEKYAYAEDWPDIKQYQPILGNTLSDEFIRKMELKFKDIKK